jgi:hypothetical protein
MSLKRSINIVQYSTHLEQIYGLYRRYIGGEKEAYIAIQKLLESPEAIVRDIIIGYVCGCEWNYTIKKSQYDQNKHFIVFTNEDDYCNDDEIQVINQELYESTLYEFHEVYFMPRTLPNKKRFKCKNFEQLISEVKLVNPLWILEMHAIFNQWFVDKARCYPTELNYSINEKEYQRIMVKLKNLV